MMIRQHLGDATKKYNEWMDEQKMETGDGSPSPVFTFEKRDSEIIRVPSR